MEEKKIETKVPGQDLYVNAGYLFNSRVPFKEKKISVITLIAQGTNDNISALTGKLGRVEGITVNSMLTKKTTK